ncbi:hypothetical protein GCM10011396_09700 [Undibacterium terreum]|uniref:Teneurin NHL domain-containing protein n=1 Tax=Undibacterium terreum TaxID=1224302 RepID=A0A916U8R0_9BURK|nr:hypothetical protein GCM10011396_09700 [Undibacterium terreum]
MQNAAANTAVSWSLPAGSPGSLDAVSGNTVHYLPPAAGSLSEDATVSITASAGQATQTVNVKLHPSPGVYLVAGRIGGQGNLDGTGSAARFAGLGDITRDAQDNLYAVDYANASIRKISPSGVVSSLPLSQALLQLGTINLVADKNGVLYGANLFGIYKITADGNFSMLAGSQDTSGYADGNGTAARFGSIVGMSFDSAGNLLVSDQKNNVIRKVSPNGAVTTIAGSPGIQGSTNGPLGQALFDTLGRITQDTAGNTYVADNYTLRKISVAGVVSTLAGSPALQNKPVDGVGANAGFGYFSGMTTDAAGNIFIADKEDNGYLIRKVSPDGTVSTLAGNTTYVDPFFNYADGVGIQAKFGLMNGIAADTAGNLFVTDFDNRVIRKISAAAVVTTFAGTSNKGPYTGNGDGTGAGAVFTGPGAVRSDAAGNIFVLDSGMRKITAGGVVTTIPTTINSTGSPDFILQADGSFVADNIFGLIYKVTATGAVTEFAGHDNCASGGSSGFCTPGYTDGTGSAAKFNFPQGLGPDGKGNILVVDGNLLRKVSSTAQVTTLLSFSPDSGKNDANGNSVSYKTKAALVTDPDGNSYITDRSTVSKIGADGKITLIAGQSGQIGLQDGSGAAALFSFPSGIARDSDGTLYVADTGNNAIRKIDTSGKVTTIAGGTGEGNRTGPLPAALRHPYGITIVAPKTLVISADTCVLRIVLP